MRELGFQRRLIDEVIESEKALYSAEHMITIVYPVVKDERLILRALERSYRALTLCISAILKHEYLYGRIELVKDKSRNLKSFFRRCSSYGLNDEEREIIKEILFIGKKHKESGVEFPKRGKIIILDDDLKTFQLSLDKAKSFIKVIKKLLENTNNNLGFNRKGI